MKATFLQHEDAFRPGKLAEYLTRRYAAVTVVLRNHEVREDHPDLAQTDLLISLGSPVSVYRTDVDWVARERRIVAKAMTRGTPVLGICFGAQLITALAGGSVEPIGQSHVGWMENDSVAAPVWRGPWFRFHQEHCQVTPGTEVLARSRGTVQAFQCDNAIGLQFHPEMETAMVQELLPSMHTAYAVGAADAWQLLEDTRAQESATAAARDALFEEILLRRFNLV
jgi:GMP synthase-like glutamine amidotransferase